MNSSLPSTPFERALGYVIDSLFLGVLIGLIALAIKSSPILEERGYLFAAFYAYKVLCETFIGTTLGKWGLRVRSGKFPPVVTALIRNSWILIPGLIMLVQPTAGQIVGMVLMLLHIVTLIVDKQVRSIFDKLADAIVTKK